mmetsp:Transcript_1301/g.2534  ORF Transcript_1301/g.2534 Transcript_1301/m.2534 type:complete len:466 (-) Transcript_1301:2910-4307(-)
MGKAGNERKKKKRKLLQQQQEEQQQQSLAVDDGIDPMDLDIAMEVLTKMMQSSGVDEEATPLWKQKEYKPLRAKIYSLYSMMSADTGTGKTLCGRVSEALLNADYVQARHLLEEMQYRQITPKLGSLQRWVRECDAAFGVTDDGKTNNTEDQDSVLRCLDAMIRCTQADIVTIANKDQKSRPLINRYPEWCPPSEASSVGDQHENTESSETKDFQGQFREVFREKGMDRRPQNKHDAVIYQSLPSAAPLCPLPKDAIIKKYDVPFVPGCFVLTDVLTPTECTQIIAAAEAIKFMPDEPVEHAETSRSTLAHNVFWLADSELNTVIYDRCKAFLPDSLGLNARWRVYRYEPGAVYRPHIDGAWPGSGLDPKTGKYVYDVFGDRKSKMTFLIRLNDDFSGGSTTYYIPAPEPGFMNARAVSTPKGSVVCFPHGDAQGSLLHEGSEVTKGYKYVIRTDVLYYNEGVVT